MRIPADDRYVDEVYRSLVSPDDVTVRTIPLPDGIHGFVLPDPEDHYNIYLNSLDPYPVQLRALRHELDHILHGDCWDHVPVDEIETA